MYKLVAVGGKLRGQEFVLEEGENILGRAPDVDHVIRVDGVSKRHLSITVNGDTCFVEDLGSSNGTFINSKLIKKMTAVDGDQIAIPNVIFQVVYVKEKKVVITKKIAKDSDEETESSNYDLEDVMPNNFLGKVKWVFRKRVMSVIYSFNEQYEWNVLLGIFIFLFLVANIALTIQPVLFSGRRLLIKEIASRGKQFANEVARFNAASLSRGDLDRLNTIFLDNDAEGVQSYELFDLEGRIVRPVGKLNSYVNDAFSIEALKFFKSEQNLYKPLIEGLGAGEIGIGKAILAHNVQTGRQEPVGIIAIRFTPKTLREQSSLNSSAYLESFISTSFVGVIFFGIIYYMTVTLIQGARRELEEVLRGKRKELSNSRLFLEMQPLRNSINSLLQRIRELQDEDGGEFAEAEDDAPYVRNLYEFMQGAQGPVIILNSEKLIEHINPECEDLVGMRESSAAGTSLLDSARDQGFAATVIDLCDQSASNEGTNQSEAYELTGKDYMVHVSALIGKDSFAKAFYVTFVIDD